MSTWISKLGRAAGWACMVAALAPAGAWAQSGGKHSDKEIREDIVRHRAMAAAHEAAARCLESGRTHEACMKELQVACKGLGIGKTCGMRHVH